MLFLSELVQSVIIHIVFCVTLPCKLRAEMGSGDLKSVSNKQPFAACLSLGALLGKPAFAEDHTAWRL